MSPAHRWPWPRPPGNSRSLLRSGRIGAVGGIIPLLRNSRQEFKQNVWTHVFWLRLNIDSFLEMTRVVAAPGYTNIHTKALKKAPFSPVFEERLRISGFTGISGEHLQFQAQFRYCFSALAIAAFTLSPLLLCDCLALLQTESQGYHPVITATSYWGGCCSGLLSILIPLWSSHRFNIWGGLGGGRTATEGDSHTGVLVPPHRTVCSKHIYIGVWFLSFISE